MPASGPNVLVIAFYGDRVKNISARLFGELSKKARIIFVTTEAEALKHLTETKLQAVLLADAVIINDSKKHPLLVKEVVNYAKRGGRVVMCSILASNARFPELKAFMKRELGLPWEFGEYGGQQLYLNPAGVNLCHYPGLIGTIYTKFVCLSNVEPASSIMDTKVSPCHREDDEDDDDDEDEDDYRAPGRDYIESYTTGIAFTRFHDGWVGFSGDVNSLEVSDVAILAMVGLVRNDVCFKCSQEFECRKGMPPLACAGCKKALYCSPRCQRADWDRHEFVCDVEAWKFRHPTL
ncbi:hypothetical protein BDZ91DRAFT_845249 [Kalaharituber pfeilii]|nr:hypothetical protein BDZ91DRAFT_845249 [Kalaharituber pfeilii]